MRKTASFAIQDTQQFLNFRITASLVLSETTVILFLAHSRYIFLLFSQLNIKFLSKYYLICIRYSLLNFVNNLPLQSI